MLLMHTGALSCMFDSAYLVDKGTRTARTVQFGDGLNFIALIESLSAERRLATSRIFYEATFIEVQ